jgi:hypothetical protein
VILDDVEKPAFARFAVLSCGDSTVLSQSTVRGCDLFTGKGRCASCHIANRFHNVNAGFQRIAADVGELASAFSPAKAGGTNGDTAIRSDQNSPRPMRLIELAFVKSSESCPFTYNFRFSYTE